MLFEDGFNRTILKMSLNLYAIAFYNNANFLHNNVHFQAIKSDLKCHIMIKRTINLCLFHMNFGYMTPDMTTVKRE